MSKRKKNSAELLLMGGNPRTKNPAELLLMGANPNALYGIRWDRNNKVTGAYQTQDVAEKVLKSFGGKGKVIGINPLDRHSTHKKSRGRNPSAVEPETQQARDAVQIAEGFKAQGWEWVTVIDEPHMRSGDYAQLGMLEALIVKPTSSGSTTQVQEITVGKDVRVLADTSRRQLYFADGKPGLSERDIKTFTADRGDEVELGTCRAIVYRAAKYHREVENAMRGKMQSWIHEFGIHEFGEEGGSKPTLFYSRSTDRLILRGGSYRVEDAGIVN